MARDASGNQAAVQTMTYTLKLVKNIRTGNIYTSIQSAIDDSSTLNGDTIQVHAGTFTENILITKKLTLMAVTGENVILQSFFKRHYYCSKSQCKWYSNSRIYY